MKPASIHFHIYPCLCVLETKGTYSGSVQHPELSIEKFPWRFRQFLASWRYRLRVWCLVYFLELSLYLPPIFSLCFTTPTGPFLELVLSISQCCFWTGKKVPCCKEHPSPRTKCTSSRILLRLSALGAEAHSGSEILCGFIKLYLMEIFIPNPFSPMLSKCLSSAFWFWSVFLETCKTTTT